MNHLWETVMHLCRFGGKLTFSVKAIHGILFTAMRHIQTMSISGIISKSPLNSHLFRIVLQYQNFRRGHKNQGSDPSVLILFDNGYFTTVSGEFFILNLNVADMCISVQK